MSAKRRLIATVLAASLVAAAAGCGGDDDSEPEAGGVVAGKGYEYTLPDGWIDASTLTGPAAEQLGLGGDVIDSLSTDDPEAEFATNVNVATGPAPGVTLKQLTAQALLTIRDPQLLPPGVEFTSEPTRPEQTELAGSPAQQFEYEGNFMGNDGELRQLMTLHGGQAFVVTFVSPAGEFEADSEDFESVTDSWQWD